jgi:hypothetical protein
VLITNPSEFSKLKHAKFHPLIVSFLPTIPIPGGGGCGGVVYPKAFGNMCARLQHHFVKLCWLIAAETHNSTIEQLLRAKNALQISGFPAEFPHAPMFSRGRFVVNLC